jgi:hypothetical protein
VRGDVGRALFGGAIDVARDRLAVPVDEFGNVVVVVDVNDRALAFLEAQQRTGKLAIVERRRDDVLRSKFGQAGRDAQGVVSCFWSRLFSGMRKTCL